MLTAERLRELLDYDPETGIFTWRKTLSNRAVAGKVAGSPNGKGYIRITLDRRRYVAHRLAHLWMTGAFPVYDLDHENTIRSDNKWKNLRHATRAQNIANAKTFCTSRSGVKGVFWSGRDQNWRATICINGRNKHLGSFDDIGLAAEFRRLAADMVFGEFARH